MIKKSARNLNNGLLNFVLREFFQILFVETMLIVKERHEVPAKSVQGLERATVCDYKGRAKVCF